MEDGSLVCFEVFHLSYVQRELIYKRPEWQREPPHATCWDWQLCNTSASKAKALAVRFESIICKPRICWGCAAFEHAAEKNRSRRCGELWHGEAWYRWLRCHQASFAAQLSVWFAADAADRNRRRMAARKSRIHWSNISLKSSPAGPMNPWQRA